MKTIVLALAIGGLVGCMPALNIPDPYPIKTVTYELDQDTQKWTQQDCTTTAKQREMPSEMQTVCYKKTISAPPPGIGSR